MYIICIKRVVEARHMSKVKSQPASYMYKPLVAANKRPEKYRRNINHENIKYKTYNVASIQAKGHN